MGKRFSTLGWLLAMLLIAASLAANVCEASCMPLASAGGEHACCAHNGSSTSLRASQPASCHHTVKEEVRSLRAASDAAPSLVPVGLVAPAALLSVLYVERAHADPPRTSAPPSIPLRI